jgi:hypothetical protein
LLSNNKFDVVVLDDVADVNGIENLQATGGCEKLRCNLTLTLGVVKTSLMGLILGQNGVGKGLFLNSWNLMQNCTLTGRLDKFKTK